MRLVRDALLLGAAAAGTRLLWQTLQAGRSHPWGQLWERTNHADRPVTLLEGAALVGGSTAAAVCTGQHWGHNPLPFVLTSWASGGLGTLDDHRQDADRKGLAGHLRALAHGQVTTGAIKILGLSATGLLAVLLQGQPDPRTGRGAADPGDGGCTGTEPSRAAVLWRTVAGAGVIAGSANLANLFDLRPGRALKVGVLTAVPLILRREGSPAAAVTLGSCLALLPEDLAGVSMLGDTGANPLGAMLGVALTHDQGPTARTVSLLVVTALTLASERVSFTRVIEATPGLRELDALGRPQPVEMHGS